ncbi:MAG TPA: HIT family protein [Caulobacteraceae bacterium]|nr:HIT family protein [Caulobacteraceae bacterium]
MFALDPAFARTSHAIAELPFCAARLQADARWPWIVLIPRVEGVREIEDLPPAGRGRLMSEIVVAGRAVRAVGRSMGLAVEKLNVGLIGNVTPQLHAHIVGRRSDDPAWPAPVWGVGGAVPYGPDVLEGAIAAAAAALRG